MTSHDISHDEFRRVWLLKREIIHESGRPARFDGFARITRKWRYLEWGNLEIAGADYTSGQQYRWKPVIGGFDICFDDGKPFHGLRFESPTAEHTCAPDHYLVSYDFRAFPIWRSTWKVTGPRKAYTMHSIYTPFSPQAAMEQ